MVGWPGVSTPAAMSANSSPMTSPKICGAAWISTPMFRPITWTWCLYSSSQLVTAASPPATPYTMTRPVTRLAAARLAPSMVPPADSSTRSAPVPPVSRSTSAARSAPQESRTWSAPSPRPVSCLPGQAAAVRGAQERAVGLGDVAEVDTGGGDPDQDLTRARDRYRRVGYQAQVLRAIQGRLLQGAHGGGDAHGNRLPFLSLRDRGRHTYTQEDPTRTEKESRRTPRPSGAVPGRRLSRDAALPGRRRPDQPDPPARPEGAGSASFACDMSGRNPNPVTTLGAPNEETPRRAAPPTVSTQIPYGW